jgi:potassium-dependent mechanosensitive channel
MPLQRRLTQLRPGRLLRLAIPWVLICGLASGLSSAADVQVPPLQDLREETSRIVQASAELTEVAARREVETERLAAQLARDEDALRAQDIDLDMLHAARLALDWTRERIGTVEGQAAHQRAVARRLEQGILALARQPDPNHAGFLQSGRQAALQLLRDQAEAVRGLVDTLDRLIAVNRRLLLLREQRLRLLQARVRLDALGGPADADGGDRAFTPDPAVRALVMVIAESLRAGAQLSAEAAAISGEDADAAARRETVEMRLEDASVRGDLAQNDLELLGIRRRLVGLAALREDPSMPVSLLEAAVDQLEQMKSQLGEYLVELQGERRMAAARHTLHRDPDATLDIPPPGAEMEAAIALQEQEVRGLLQRTSAEQASCTAAAAQVYRQSLTDRHPLPVTGEEWQRIRNGAVDLPRLLVHEIQMLAWDVERRAATLGPNGWSNLIGGALLLTIVTYVVPRTLRRRLVDPDLNRRVAVPARALAYAIPRALPAILWTWIGGQLGLPHGEFVLGLVVLGIWPVSAFALALARGALFGLDPARVQSPARLGFYRRLRWGLVFAALVSGLYLLTRSLPTSPPLGDVLDRLAMIGLLLLAVPAFGLRGLILNLEQGALPPAAPDCASGSFWHRAWALGELSRLIAITMVIAAVLGLLGYANLAWAIASGLGWLALVTSLLYIAVGTLGDLRDHVAGRLNGELGDFWRRHFLAPAHGFAVALVCLVAGWALLRLWGWSSRTLPIGALLDWSQAPLLEVGSLRLTPWGLVISVVLAVAAVSTGAWVKRVSFQLAFGRLHDRGLRQALATITQYTVMVCGLLLALKAAGLDLTNLVVFSASLGVGIGFGLQNIANNFISGILLLVERPLRVGDIVTVGVHEGEVSRLGIRSLTVRTFDKQEVFIPNGTVVSGDLINWTHSDDILRTVLTVGIGYGEDPDRAIGLIRALLAEYEAVLREPPPHVSLWEFGDSALVLRVEYCAHFVGDAERTELHSQINRGIWYGLQAAGISIPYPQRDLHVRMVPGTVPMAIPDGLSAAMPLGQAQGHRQPL